MKRDEWMIFHGFNNFEMDCIDNILKIFKGKIVAIYDNPTRILVRPII